MTSPAVAIMAPLREELAPLLGRGENGPTLCFGTLTVHRERIGDADVWLAVSGEGSRRATAAAATLLRESRAPLLLLLGIAGGLAPTLRPGALVVAETIVDGVPGPPTPDPVLVDRAVRAGATRATVVSSPRMLCSAAEKARAWAATGMRTAAVVDLESGAFAREAAARGVPFVVARAVCDTAGEDLPLDFNRLATEDGQVRRFAVARRALFQPSLLPRLADLRRRVGLCAVTLARFARLFLAGAVR